MQEIPSSGGVPALREYLTHFAEHEATGSPLYAEWARGVAVDDDLLELFVQLPGEKRQVTLFFAAARLQGIPPQSWSAVRSSVLARWPDIAETMRRRRTQTNEPGRLAVLNLALGQIPGPVALIEVGCSAGLCLYPDSWPLRYRNGESSDADVVLRPGPGHLTADQVLECTLYDGIEPPAGLPEVAARIGIDLNPLDLTDPQDRQWLKALVWPGMEHRLDRLRAGASLVRAEPPELLAGDLNDLLAEALEQVPAGATPVIFHSAVLVYLPQEDRRRFEAQTAEAAEQRGARWISNEGRDVLPQVSARLPDPGLDTHGAFVLALDGRPLALTGPHGQWARSVTLR